MIILRYRIGLSLFVALGLLLAGAWLVKPALADADSVGSIDRTFGNNGVVDNVWAPGITSVADTLIQPDGKIVTAGGLAYRDTNEQDFLVARYTISGTLDTGFGNAGQVYVRFGSDWAVGNAIARQSDGKLVVVGFVQNRSVPGDYSVAVARLNGDGSLDNSFGSGGTVTTKAGGQTARGVGMALQTDGKILVAGTRDSTLAVFRFNSNGTLDSGFGSGGVVTTSVNTGEAGESIATTVALQSDGKILAGGGAEQSGCLRGAITRYSAAGVLDNSFGTAGQVFYPRSYEFFKIAVQFDQRFVASSSTYDCTDSSPSFGTVARFNGDGSVDSSFSGGFRNFPATSTGRVMAADLLLAPDNSVWVAAFDDSAAFIAALKTDGTMNDKFGPDGIVRTPLDFSAATSISMQDDGKVVVGALKVLPNYGSFGRLTRYQTPLSCIYADVCADDFFNTAVRYLTQHGIVSGYTDPAHCGSATSCFLPYANTTRGQMAKIVALAFNLSPYTPPTGQTFSDVPRSDSFFQYVETLAHHNIVSGDSCGAGCLKYHPYDDIRRGQLTKIITLAAGWTLLNPANPTFSDVATDNTFYTYIETAVAHGVISGYANGTFGWTASATRGQIAKIVYLSIDHTEQVKSKQTDKSSK